ncbi:MAG: hypothetical protein J07HQW2_00278 [Haloquadratum walsbyi J07HQW2]|jgi:hypothetical protein|uniref:Uncharacterized protein n=1 Tax=Haloquadratum walsbyi J07HQW2 TaxID=1238425 RepID=U1MU64_9EURY|nr:MAG: hypothetical protein J07HQW2_00278 [Haloquadratum walsbyi J07HQW2]
MTNSKVKVSVLNVGFKPCFTSNTYDTPYTDGSYAVGKTELHFQEEINIETAKLIPNCE